jgi:FlaA1/EpsC-like NDP-sugar epimerase
MNWTQRLNTFFAGLAIGILFPIIIYTLYWLLRYHQINFPVRFTRFLMNGYLLSNVMRMCGLANLILFYFGLNRSMDKFNKGIIVSVVLYLLLIFYVNYYLEPEYI